MPKEKPLHAIFSDIPPHYDLINHLSTLSLDTRWRLALARKCLEKNPLRFLDLCCGTGDLVLTVSKISDGKTDLSGLDFSEHMLEFARDKANKMSKLPINFVYGDASAMPFGDETFDVVGISFAFRNLTYANPASSKHLSEILRVLKTGGRFVIAETSQPKSMFVRFFFHLYMRWLVAPAGGLISGNWKAYRYLAESTCRYFDRNQITDLLLKAGFSEVTYKPMLLGASSIVCATK